MKDKCYGCKACECSCLVNAIHMKKDFLGFSYPHLYEENCVSCGKCHEVCPINHNSKSKTIPYEVYAMKHKERKISAKSQSAGVFFTMALSFIEEGGIVCGARMDCNGKVYHRLCKTKEEISELQGSKYVQSDLKNVYKEIKKELHLENNVLFCGTPCQIAGLKNYLGNKRNGLLTMDLICHGVPSPRLWQDFLCHMEEKYKGKIEKANFRDNEKGWSKHYESFVIHGKKRFSQVYALLFYSHAFLRTSCFSCQFADTHRVGDISIGDYRGIEKVFPMFYDEEGISLVLINTEKGKIAMEKIFHHFQIQKSQMNQCMQPPLMRPSIENENRKAILEEYINKRFSYIAKKYGKENFFYRLKRKFKKVFHLLK